MAFEDSVAARLGGERTPKIRVLDSTLENPLNPLGLEPFFNMEQQPKITIGIMEGRTEINGCLNGPFRGEPFGSRLRFFRPSGNKVKKPGMIVLLYAARREIHRSPSIRLTPEGGVNLFALRT